MERYVFVELHLGSDQLQWWRSRGKLAGASFLSLVCLLFLFPAIRFLCMRVLHSRYGSSYLQGSCLDPSKGHVLKKPEHVAVGNPDRSGLMLLRLTGATPSAARVLPWPSALSFHTRHLLKLFDLVREIKM
jgi:hypothetical protein